MPLIETDRYGSPTGLTKSGRRLIWAGVAFLALIILALFSVRAVDAREVGVITVGGDVSRTADSGYVLKWPWERMHTMKVSTQSYETDAAAASRELQDVHATLVLNYELPRDQALNVYKTIGEDYRKIIVDSALQETFKATTAQFTNQELIERRAEVKARAVTALSARLATYGLKVRDLNIVNFAFSAEFSKAIEARQVAEQNVLQAEANAKKAKAEAQGRFEAAELDAKAQAAQRETLSDQLLRLKWIEAWNGELPTYVGGDASTLLQVPQP